jgi:hypothetical protein
MSIGVDVQIAARKVLLRLLEPLSGFVLDSGLSIADVNLMLREAIVRCVAARQLENADRVNISGIAASTGIPRGEISRILKSPRRSVEQAANRHQPATNRTIIAWRQHPKFTTAGGHPADLRIYGPGATFETLVKSVGRGIPTRAILEELLNKSAVVLRSSQIIRLKSGLAVDLRFTPEGIERFGHRATTFLSILIEGLRHPEDPPILAYVSKAIVLHNAIAKFRGKITIQEAQVLAEIQAKLRRWATKNGASRKSTVTRRVTLTVCIHQGAVNSQPKKGILAKRRNLRRIS